MMGANYKTKKELKSQIGKQLDYIETSMFGNEYSQNGTFTMVGPSPQKRTWFARVTVVNDLITKVE